MSDEEHRGTNAYIHAGLDYLCSLSDNVLSDSEIAECTLLAVVRISVKAEHICGTHNVKGGL
jgi:hypothetical protein